MFQALLIILVALYLELSRRGGEKKIMGAMDDFQASLGAVVDDVKRLGDDVQLILDKLATSNDPVVQQATEMLKRVDSDLDSTAEKMEAALNPTPPTPPAP